MLAFSPGDADAWQGILARVELAAGGPALAVSLEGRAFLISSGSLPDSLQDAVRRWVLANPVHEQRSGTLEGGRVILATPWKFGILAVLPEGGRELAPVYSRLRGAAAQLGWLFGDLEARPRTGGWGHLGMHPPGQA
jgi:hypothetical protein